MISKALTTKKPTKAAAFDTLLGIIDQYNIAESPELLGLLRYFAPSAPTGKPKTPEDWVRLAVADRDVRKYLNYVYSSGSQLVASNGHRIHVINTTPEAHPHGFYHPETMTPATDITADYTFPDYRRLFSASPDIITAIVKTERGVLRTDSKLPKELTRLTLITGETVVLNSTYYNQATAQPYHTLRYLSTQALQFDSDNTAAIVMPIRQSEEEEGDYEWFGC